MIGVLPRKRARKSSSSLKKYSQWIALGLWACALYFFPWTSRTTLSPTIPDVCDGKWPLATKLARLQLFPFIRERIKCNGLDFKRAYYQMAASKRLVVVIRRNIVEFAWEGDDKHAIRCVNGLKEMLVDSISRIRRADFRSYPLVLLFNLHSGAGPEVRKSLKPGQVPIFSYCKARGNEKHILFPRYYMNENGAWREPNGTNQELKQFRLDSFSNVWAVKAPVAVFRGAASSSSRVELVRLGQMYPDKLNTGFTSLPPYSRKWNPPDKIFERMTLKEQVEKFKYIIYAVGAGDQCADRLLFYLTGDSVVLKQDSPYEEWWYRFLEPYTHYFPVASNWTDLLPIIEHLRQHDQHLSHVPRAARRFMNELVSWEATTCYAAQLIDLYSDLLTVRSEELGWIRELVNYEVIHW